MEATERLDVLRVPGSEFQKKMGKCGILDSEENCLFDNNKNNVQVSNGICLLISLENDK